MHEKRRGYGMDVSAGRRRMRGLGHGALAAIAAAAMAGGGAGAAAATTPAATTFGFTGAEQTYTVPAGVHVFRVDAIGAPGGAGSTATGGAHAAGGLGGAVRADLSVQPGQVLDVVVGGAGVTDGTRAFNGGGRTNAGAGGGGGGTDLRWCSMAATCTGTDTLASRIVVAGGGGGGGSAGAGAGHAGGDGGAAGAEGAAGTLPPFSTAFGGPGGGATTSAGGGTADENRGVGLGNAGTFGGGGDTNTAGSDIPAGAGGGGWFGGAGAGSNANGAPEGTAGGGGGSSFVSVAAANALIAVATTTTPSVTIAPLLPTADLDSTGVTFAATTIGQSAAAATVTLANHGDAPLGVASVGLDGAADFAIVASTCSDVPVAGTCQVTLRFTPTATGARAATLKFATEAGLADRSVTLDGTGVAPPVTTPAPPGGGTPAPPKKATASAAPACHRTGRITRCSLSFPTSAFANGATPDGASFSISRGARVLARGTVRVSHGRVTLSGLPRLSAGTYTLVVRAKHGHTERILSHETIKVR